jgi:cardiolipin synthase A/B
MPRLKKHHKLVFSILIVCAIIASLLAIAQDQETLKIESAYGAEDTRFPAYLAALLGADATGGNRYQVLTNGDQIFPSMLGAIAEAKRRISFETYIYDKGSVGDQFTAALEAAARRGVQVDLVVDAMGSDRVPAETVQRLRDGGAQIGQFGRPNWYTLEELNYRTHRKILVVDGQVGFTGGVGVADHWLGHAQDPDHWRDTMVRIEGPLVRLMEGAFYENFVETLGPAKPTLDPPDEGQPPTPRDSAFILRSSPTGGSNDLKRLYLMAISAARRTLDICTPYFITDESSEWSLAEAVKRGVKIRVLVEGDHTDAKPVKYSSRSAYERLMASGIELYEYQPTMMHTKAMVVDGVWSMFGSANFDNRSLELNDELNVAVSDRDLAQRLLQDFETDVKSAKRLDLATWRRRAPLEKAREYFWSYFGEIF